jgi:hypothetical protein
VRDDLALVEDLGGLGVEEELLAQAGALGEGHADRRAAEPVADLAEELHAGHERERPIERGAQARGLRGLAQRVGDLDADLAVARLAAVAHARAQPVEELLGRGIEGEQLRGREPLVADVVTGGWRPSAPGGDRVGRSHPAARP